MADANGLSNDKLLTDLEQRAKDAEKRISALESGKTVSMAPEERSAATADLLTCD